MKLFHYFQLIFLSLIVSQNSQATLNSGRGPASIVLVDHSADVHFLKVEGNTLHFRFCMDSGIKELQSKTTEEVNQYCPNPNYVSLSMSLEALKQYLFFYVNFNQYKFNEFVSAEAAQLIGYDETLNKRDLSRQVRSFFETRYQNALEARNLKGSSYSTDADVKNSKKALDNYDLKEKTKKDLYARIDLLIAKLKSNTLLKIKHSETPKSFDYLALTEITEINAQIPRYKCGQSGSLLERSKECSAQKQGWSGERSDLYYSALEKKEITYAEDAKWGILSARGGFIPNKSYTSSNRNPEFQELYFHKATNLYWAPVVGSYGRIGKLEDYANPQEYCDQLNGSANDDIGLSFGFSMISDIHYRLPTIEEFTAADQDGLIFFVDTVPNAVNKASVNNLKQYTFVSDKGEELKSKFHYNNLSPQVIRCVADLK